MQQMTIWDFLPLERLEDIPEPDMVRQIGEAIGVEFRRDDFFEDYRAKAGKAILTVEYDRYLTEEHYGTLFIGVGIDVKTEHLGMASPCDSINEAIVWFERHKARWEKMKPK